MDIKVYNLMNQPTYLGEVSELMWEEWDSPNGALLEQIIYRTKHSLNINRIPMTFIALDKKELVGFVSLWNNNLTSRQDLSPFLSTLYVKEDYRNQGIGHLLQKEVLETVQSLGYSNVYLISDLDHYFEQCGWEFMEYVPLYNGEETKLYKFEI